MLCNTKKMILEAQKRGYAVPAFNIHTLEDARACVEAAAELRSPIILQATPSTFKFSGLEAIIGVAVGLSATYPDLPLALHMDHHHDYDQIVAGIKAGIKSVMIDGSQLSFLENIKLTKKVVNFARKYDVTVEAELGAIPGVEDELVVKHVLRDDPYTTPKMVNEFVAATNVDSLAVAIGNAHGLYLSKPKLNLDRLKEIKSQNPIPLVLHGGSGLTVDQVQACIANGVAKVNIGTELKPPYIKAIIDFLQANKDKQITDSKLNDPRWFLQPAVDAIKEVAKSVIKMCHAENRY